MTAEVEGSRTEMRVGFVNHRGLRRKDITITNLAQRHIQ